MSIRKQISECLQQYRTIVVWGASGLGSTAVRLWLPVEKIAFLVDSNPNSRGNSIEGKQIKSPDAVPKESPECVVICSGAHLEIRKQLKALGFRGDVLFIYETFLPNRKLSEFEMLLVDIAATRNDNWFRFLLMKPQILLNMTFRLTRWFMDTQWLRPLYYPMFFLHAIMCVVFGIQLPPKTSIGPGLVFAHFGTIVFTARAKIGSFFTIYHGCTVGTIDSGDGPIIGDFVSQYAGSHVLGQCRIGNHTRIGANAVVLDLSSGGECALVGSPARIIKND